MTVLTAVPVVHGASFADPPAAPLPPAAAGAGGRPPVFWPPPTDHTSAHRNPTHQQGLPASSIRIPDLGITAAIGPATLHDGVLTPPRVPAEVGLWAGSSPLEASTGEVTLVGHVDWSGMPAFAFGRLASLRVGDLVYTSDRRGAQTAWRITSVTARSKSDGVDPDAFTGTRGRRRLVLITCGGPLDTSSSTYEDNVYAHAFPATAVGHDKP